MRNIWTVFKTDIRTLSKCFFACVVVVAIALLPSLYAWLNIYSNWDPYGNTGGISIAVASLDEGYTNEDGTYENKGDDVVADLREATSINWVIVDTEEEAKGGVESGDYYAAVVIDKQFSRNMYRMLTDWTGKPAITYYENAKKNAVATKITDTAVETLKRSISENYLEVVIGGIMEQSNLLAADLTADDPEAAVKGVLYQAFEGICNNLERRYQETQSDASKKEIEGLMTPCPCPACQGKRLRPEALAVTVGGKSIYDAICKRAGADNVTYIGDDETLIADSYPAGTTAIVVVGEASGTHEPAWGTATLEFPAEQQNLLQKLDASGVNVVSVVLMNRAYVMTPVDAASDAVMIVYRPGVTAGAEAVAHALFGDCAISGKLPWQIPATMDQVMLQREDLPKDIENPLYDYGFGIEVAAFGQ